ncbi:MAG: fused response regulator/phosphatase [Acidobacteria bacterium]|nr:fused response regulator/phosphatase [Acidobacteriota bacterium]
MSLGQNQLRIFVCDDQMEVREALRLLLKSNGYIVECFDGPSALMEVAVQKQASVILLDMNYTRDTTSGAEGLDLIAALREQRVPAALIAMTAWGDVSLAVQAMQRGASDFVEKPWNNDRLLQIVAKWTAAVQVEDREMAGARRVQQSLLPQNKSGDSALRYACRFLPAREVSGDYYDFFEKRPGHFGFVVADVSGKGVPAAMLMANLQALFRSHAYRDAAAPEPVLRAVNAQFHESTSPESFATAFYADLDEASQELSYINCGHPPALLRKRNGDIKMLEASALVLGAFPFWSAETGRVKLDEGDRLLVYSDGAVEAQSSSGEEFGEDRLLELFQNTAHLAPQEALPEIEAEIQKHSGVSLFDDCTLFMASLR